jgi:hypothetical protein
MKWNWLRIVVVFLCAFAIIAIPILANYAVSKTNWLAPEVAVISSMLLMALMFVCILIVVPYDIL